MATMPPRPRAAASTSRKPAAAEASSTTRKIALARTSDVHPRAWRFAARCSVNMSPSWRPAVQESLRRRLSVVSDEQAWVEIPTPEQVTELLGRGGAYDFGFVPAMMRLILAHPGIAP